MRSCAPAVDILLHMGRDRYVSSITYEEVFVREARLKVRDLFRDLGSSTAVSSDFRQALCDDLILQNLLMAS